MYYSSIIILTLSLAACAAGNASQMHKFDNVGESIECPARVCSSFHANKSIYRGTHILQPDTTNIEDTFTRF